MTLFLHNFHVLLIYCLQICNAVAVASLLNATLVLPKFLYSNVWKDPRSDFVPYVTPTYCFKQFFFFSFWCMVLGSQLLMDFHGIVQTSL